MRLLVSIDNKNTGRKMSIYRDSEWNEFVVKFYENGVHQTEANYHTDCSADAYDTANNWVNKRSTNSQSLTAPVLV